MIVCSILWFVFLVLCCSRWYKEDGVLFFCDFNRVAVIIWSLGVGLYDLELSALLHPDLLMNAVAAIVVAIFMGFELSSVRDQKLLGECFKHLKVPNNVFYWFLTIVFMIVCLRVFMVNVAAGNIRGLSNNPGMVVEFIGGYFYRLSVPIAIVCYLAARLCKGHGTKLVMSFLFVVFTLVTAVGLDRGPIVWILTGVVVYELFSYARTNGKVTFSLRSFAFILALMLVVVSAFDVFGGVRTTAQGITEISKHYQMTVDIPSGFTWIYIYLTTPLENARYALEVLANKSLTLGGNLLYPLIKFIANCFGEGDVFTGWINANATLYPYLKPVAGLTVGSFLMDAIQDFSYLGIILYPFAYGTVSLALKSVLKTRHLSSFTKVTVYALVFQEALWCIFSNTVMFGPVLVCAAFFVAADLLTTLFTPKRAGSSSGSRVAIDVYAPSVFHNRERQV